MKGFPHQTPGALKTAAENIAVVHRAFPDGAQAMHHMASAWEAARAEGLPLVRKLAGSYLAVQANVSGDPGTAGRLSEAIDEFWAEERRRAASRN